GFNVDSDPGTQYVFFQYGDGTTANQIGDSHSPEDDNRWHFFTGVLDRQNNRSNFYVDGVLRDNGSLGGAGSPSNSRPLQIGFRDSGGTNFTGQVDQVHVYNYAISQNQIIQDMNAGAATTSLGGSHSAPVGYWKFDEGFGVLAN